MGDPVIHFEIRAADAERARQFYAQLFRWTIDTDPDGYGVVSTGAGTGIDGGILASREGAPPSITFYVGVDDLEKCLSRAEELGGSRVVGPTSVGEAGSFALFADPDGNTVGLFTGTGG